MAQRLKDPAVFRDRSGPPSRLFLPSIDLLDARDGVLEKLSDDDKKQPLTKLADVTHFRVGLDVLKDHVAAAVELAPEVRALPSAVRGQLLQPHGTPAERVSVQPALPGKATPLGRGVVTDEVGVFTLALPTVSDDDRRVIVSKGLGLVVRGLGGAVTVTVPLPPAGATALGAITLSEELEELPTSVVGALVDLLEDLPAVTGPATAPVKIQLGQDACNILFEQDTVVRRFPYSVLVRLVEPRTTTVTEVFVPGKKLVPGLDGKFVFPFWPGLLGGLEIEQTRFVERVPVDKPISVDGFRDQLIGLRGSEIDDARLVPMAGTLGLGYVLNLAQVWRYSGLTLGNLVYSLPLAPGEQQRVAVSERVATAAVRESEVLDIAERSQSQTRADSSTQAVFESAFEEHVRASSTYETERARRAGASPAVSAACSRAQSALSSEGWAQPAAPASPPTAATRPAPSTERASTRAWPPSRCTPRSSARRRRGGAPSGRRSGSPPRPTARP